MPEIAPVVTSEAVSPAEQTAQILSISLPNVRSITAVLSKGVDETFPRDAVGRAKFVRDWLVKNALADLMFKNKEGTVGIFWHCMS